MTELDLTDPASSDASDQDHRRRVPCQRAARSAARSRAPTLLLLHATGAKSGQAPMAPLAYLTIDGKTIIIGSKGGLPTNPDWVHNLRANPRAHIEVGAEAYDVTARELPPDERAEFFDKVVAAAPPFGEYQAKTTRVIPLFELQKA